MNKNEQIAEYIDTIKTCKLEITNYQSHIDSCSKQIKERQTIIQDTEKKLFLITDVNVLDLIESYNAHQESKEVYNNHLNRNNPITIKTRVFNGSWVVFGVLFFFGFVIFALLYLMLATETIERSI